MRTQYPTSIYRTYKNQQPWSLEKSRKAARGNGTYTKTPFIRENKKRKQNKEKKRALPRKGIIPNNLRRPEVFTVLAFARHAEINNPSTVLHKSHIFFHLSSHQTQLRRSETQQTPSKSRSYKRTQQTNNFHNAKTITTTITRRGKSYPEIHERRDWHLRLRAKKEAVEESDFHQTLLFSSLTLRRWLFQHRPRPRSRAPLLIF